MNTVSEQMIRELISLSGTFPYPEYYSHTGKAMWKINNPFSLLKEDKIVLSPVEDGLQKAVTLALAILSKKQTEFNS